VANTQPASFGFSVQDSLGVKASCTVYALMDPTLVLSDQVTQWQALATALAGVVDGLIVDGDVRIRLVPTVDQSTKPVAGSLVVQTDVTTHVVTGGGGKVSGVDAPSWSTSLISDGEPIVDSGDGQTWVEALTGTYTGGVMTNATYQAVGALVRSFISFRKRPKRKL
jgi:hypothetical protein